MLYFNQNKIMLDGEIELNKPSFMYDGDLFVVHKFGNENFVKNSYEHFVKADVTGVLTKNLCIFTFDTENNSMEQIFEELTKIINNSGYAELFLKRQGAIK